MKNIEESDNFMNVDRISTLIDGIFAIAMTILILSIEVPIISGPVSNKIIESSLNAIIFPFLSFFLSFILLAMFWTINHRNMQHIKRIDNVFLWINVVWLMFIVIVPFSSELSGMYSNFILPHLIFNLNMLAIAILLYLSIYYADNKGLISDTMENNKKKSIIRSSRFFILIAMLAVVLSFITPSGSGLIYLAVLFEKFF